MSLKGERPTASRRARLPEKSEEWDRLRERLTALGADDFDWRNKKTAVYVFHPGEDVMNVAKDAYALYQSENALGPAAFPSLRRMEEEVIGIALNLFHCPEEAIRIRPPSQHDTHSIVSAEEARR